MLYICTSMYLEAEPFIKKLKLKKDLTYTKFQVFKNQDITLLITGAGKLKSAISLTFLLSQNTLSSKDILINIGICGCNNKSIPLGSCFLCNKIIDNDTKRTFYPDILFKHNFNESSIETSSKVISNLECSNRESNLFDMESSGIYEAATVFFQPHQIFFIKIVSDYLDSSMVTKEFISQIIVKNSDAIIKWTSSLIQNFKSNTDILNSEEKDLCSQVCNNLKFSSSMENNLKHLLCYAKLLNYDLTQLLEKYLHIECKSKNEGKIYFEKIKHEIIR